MDTTGENEINMPQPERVVTSVQAKAFAQQALGALLSLNNEEGGEAPMTRAAATRSGDIEATDVITLSSNGIPALYIVNFGNGNGYMAISADKEQANPMVMFSDLGNFELSMLEEDSPLALYINEKVEVVAENILQAGNRDPECYEKWDYLEDVLVNEDGEEINTSIELVSVASLGDDVRLPY
jgi:hypothetical protein